MTETPKTKEALLEDIRRQRDALEKFVASLAPEKLEAPGAIADWSVKDVLAHLAEWEQLLLVWYQAGLRGELPRLPAEGYTWAQMDDLNQAIYEKYHGWSLQDVQDFYHSSYAQVLEAVQGMAESDLFTPGRFAWTKQNTLADYVVPCTSEHYEWAREEMSKRWMGKNN
jgi:uncharacterized protein (TIGR03083 family)